MKSFRIKRFKTKQDYLAFCSAPGIDDFGTLCLIEDTKQVFLNRMNISSFLGGDSGTSAKLEGMIKDLFDEKQNEQEKKILDAVSNDLQKKLNDASVKLETKTSSQVNALTKKVDTAVKEFDTKLNKVVEDNNTASEDLKTTKTELSEVKSQVDSLFKDTKQSIETITSDLEDLSSSNEENERAIDQLIKESCSIHYLTKKAYEAEPFNSESDIVFLEDTKELLLGGNKVADYGKTLTDVTRVYDKKKNSINFKFVDGSEKEVDLNPKRTLLQQEKWLKVYDALTFRHYELACNDMTAYAFAEKIYPIRTLRQQCLGSTLDLRIQNKTSDSVQELIFNTLKITGLDTAKGKYLLQFNVWIKPLDSVPSDQTNFYKEDLPNTDEGGDLVTEKDGYINISKSVKCYFANSNGDDWIKMESNDLVHSVYYYFNPKDYWKIKIEIDSTLIPKDIYSLALGRFNLYPVSDPDWVDNNAKGTPDLMSPRFIFGNTFEYVDIYDTGAEFRKVPRPLP